MIYFRCRPLNGRCGPIVVNSPFEAKTKFRIKLSQARRNDCFYTAVGRRFVRKENEVIKFVKKHIKKVDHEAMSISKITKFLRLNKHLDVRINVFFLEDEDCFPIYRSRNSKARNVVNLLLYKTMRGESVFHHFALIPDLSKFTRNMYRKDGKTSYQKSYMCENCSNTFSIRTTFIKHQRECFKNEPENILLQPDGCTIKFTKFLAKFRKPFVGYLDFESKHIETDGTCVKCKNLSSCIHRTTITAVQTPIAYSLVILDFEDEIFFSKSYAGEDCIDNLIDAFVDISERLEFLNDNPKKMIFTDRNKRHFLNATHCHICEEPFDEENDGTNIQVRDHDHYLGHYLGAAHLKCNFSRCIQKEIPVFCHNFSGYDSHLIIKAIKNDKRIWRMSAIPYNTEKLRTLTLNNIQMLDSWSFLQGSLGELVDNLAKSESKFPILKQSGLFKTEEQFKLLLKKGVFPYEFLTSIDILKKTKQIPERSAFYNTLTDSHISDSDYEHAQQVFKVMKCKSMYSYMMLYMKLDTFLLADVFTEFRNTMISKMVLDPANFISLPSYAYECMLRYTGVEIDHITDLEVYFMMSQNIRGGFSFISSRIETSTNYNTGEEEHCIDYLDANNLYGGAQSRALPVSDYRFLKKKDFNKIDIANLSEESKTGYIFEVDLDYPKELHGEHRSFPLAPEKMIISNDLLSPYQKHCQNLLNLSNIKVPKLVATFREREKYVIHGQNLKLYLKLGMKLTKIHRVLAFTQSKFLKKFIDFCTKMRSESKTEFGKRMYKLVANSNYGKFIENKSKHLQVIFCSTAEFLRKWIMSPRYSSFRIINDELVAIFLKKATTRITQAYLIGFSILELSKEFMYRSYYEYIKPRLGKECRVLMSDTDSLFLASKYKKNNLDSLRDILDTSNFEKNHPLYTLKNKAQLGFFKSETGSNKIARFIGLRSKCYAFELKNFDYHTKCKGVKKTFRKKIPVSAFAKCLEEICSYDTTQYTLNSKNHQIQLAKQRKLCFSSFDDKTYLLNCGLHSLPYFSSEIRKNEKCQFC